MRRLLSLGWVGATALALAVPVVVAAPAHAAVSTTVVLTFDTGAANQSVAESMLNAHGMHGTFYVNSNSIDTPGYLTWDQLAQFASDGHDIGGETLDHLDLTAIPAEQAQVQVCQDRANIASHGLAVKSFAYPFGLGYATASVRSIVANCGYNSARRAWGLYSTAPVCGTTGCGYPYASAIPPSDPYAVPTPDSVQTTTTLDDLERYVTQAEQHGGGLVPIVFQQICNGCGTYSVTPEVLQAFLDWLQLRAADGTVVKSTDEVVGGPLQPVDTTPPTSSIACDGAACTAGWYGASMHVSLSATDGTGRGVAAIRYTTDGSDPTLASPVYTAPFTLPSAKTVKFRAYDVPGNPEATQSQFLNVDAASPKSSIACNGAACAPWYDTSEAVSLAATDSGGSGLAAIHYTTDGSVPTSASLLYDAPLAVSASTTIKFLAMDNAGNAEATRSVSIGIDRTAPRSAIKCRGLVCSTRWYKLPVPISFPATDTGGSGVAAIHYTTNGSVPTLASPVYTGRLTISATKIVKAIAVDRAGLVSTVASVRVRVDVRRPTLAISLPAAASRTRPATVTGRVKIVAKATDAQSGVARVGFYVDGRRKAVDTTRQYAFVWNTTRVRKGIHRITVSVTDVAGNTVSKSITVIVR